MAAERQGRRIELGLVSIWHVRGITMVAHQLATALESDDIRTHVLARWEADRFANAPPVYHPRVTDGGQDPSPEATVRWATERRLDAVLFCEVHPNDWKRVEALRAVGCRVFATETLDLLRPEAVPRYGLLDGLVHAAFFTATVFAALHPSLPSLTVPWGMPPGARVPRAPDEARRDGAAKRRRFLHVSGWGGVGNRKNTDVLLHAWLDAPPPETDLVLYTQAPLDGYGATLADAVRRHRAIELHEGTVPSLVGVFDGVDLLLCPSRREGIGLPQLEALAAGVPVLVSDGHLMIDWVVPGEHAIVCPAAIERDQMWLPLARVDPAQLSECLRGAAEAPGMLETLRRHVVHDRDVWTWSWQPAVLRDEMRRMIREPGYAPDPSWSYVPAWRRAFEERRAARRPIPCGVRSP